MKGSESAFMELTGFRGATILYPLLHMGYKPLAARAIGFTSLMVDRKRKAINFIKIHDYLINQVIAVTEGIKIQGFWGLGVLGSLYNNYI